MHTVGSNAFGHGYFAVCGVLFNDLSRGLMTYPGDISSPASVMGNLRCIYLWLDGILIQISCKPELQPNLPDRS